MLLLSYINTAKLLSADDEGEITYGPGLINIMGRAFLFCLIFAI